MLIRGMNDPIFTPEQDGLYGDVTRERTRSTSVGTWLRIGCLIVAVITIAVIVAAYLSWGALVRAGVAMDLAIYERAAQNSQGISADAQLAFADAINSLRDVNDRTRIGIFNWLPVAEACDGPANAGSFNEQSFNSCHESMKRLLGQMP